jgi:hypothetical protein
MTKIHPAAFTGFGAEAQAYARGRPDYPAELLSWLRGSLGLTPDRVAVDLGAGTGKFTKLPLQTGAQIIAVEPVDAMRAQLSAGLPGVSTIPGTAQAMDLQAQAFHWFAGERALAEIHRIAFPYRTHACCCMRL